MPKKKTHEEFVNDIAQINPNIEILGKYIKSSSKILCRCKICNHEWETQANNLRYQGCPACGILKRSNKLRKSIENFIKQANEIYKNKYNYDKVDYVNDKTPIIITCPIHVDFKQIPSNHLQGKGCPECAKKQNGELFRDTTESFIKKAKKVHGDKYDYSKVNYTKSQEKVIIICPEHGEFEQRPNDHLRGKGCPKCNQSKGERIIEQYLVDNNIEYISQYSVIIDSSINPSGFAYVDFYLPTLNTIIEYNGEQHYIAKEYFGGKLGLEHQLLRDNYIRNYCKENNIKLVEIMYNKSEDKIIEICKTRIL